jgi:hypothetical protein
LKLATLKCLNTASDATFSQHPAKIRDGHQTFYIVILAQDFSPGVASSVIRRPPRQDHDSRRGEIKNPFEMLLLLFFNT